MSLIPSGPKLIPGPAGRPPSGRCRTPARARTARRRERSWAPAQPTRAVLGSRRRARRTRRKPMALSPAAFAAALLEEARAPHPWLHHPLLQMIYRGELSRARLQDVIRQQGCFFLDTLRHAAWKIISVGGYTPTFEDLERQRALIPLVVEEGGEDTVGGKTTAHAYLFIRLAEALGVARDQLFSTEYLPTTIIEKNELFLLQRSSTLEALCGGNIATESLNATHVQRMADAMERHYGGARRAPRVKSAVS